MKQIRDPLYGYIEVDEKLIDCPAIQRLRRIKQLAFASLVYPSANHTRFEHSLGVMHLSGLIAEKLGLDKKFYQICGLFHDVGHGPFSHVSEEISIVFTKKNHEKRARKILRENKDLFENYDWREIYREISGEGIGIVSGDFDADRLDYLNRDAYFTGNPLGISDALALIRGIKIFDGKIVLEEKIIGVAESILLSRYFMRKYVYYHKTCLSATSMAIKSIIEEIEKGLDVEEFMRMDDFEATIALKENKTFKRILERRLYKKLVDLEIEVSEIEFKTVREIEEEIEKILKSGEFSIYPIFFRRKIFGVKTLVLTGEGLKKFSETSEIFKAIRKCERKLERFYVFVDEKLRNKENEEKVRRLLENYLSQN